MESQLEKIVGNLDLLDHLSEHIPDIYRPEDKYTQEILNHVNGTNSEFYDLKTKSYIRGDQWLVQRMVDDFEVTIVPNASIYVKDKLYDSKSYWFYRNGSGLDGSDPHIMILTDDTFRLNLSSFDSFKTFKLTDQLWLVSKPSSINGLPITPQTNCMVFFPPNVHRGRFGNYFFDLPFDIGSFYEWSKQNPTYLDELDHLVLITSILNRIVYDKESNTSDRYSVLKPNGVHRSLKHINYSYSLTARDAKDYMFYAMCCTRKIYSVGIYWINEFAITDTYRDLMIHGIDTTLLKKKKKPGVVNISMHLRYGDFCMIPTGGNFITLHFSYYYECLNDILTSLSDQDVNEINIVLFSQPVDYFIYDQLKKYLIFKITESKFHLNILHESELDELETQNLNELELMYHISTYDYTVTSNSTFSHGSSILARDCIVYSPYNLYIIVPKEIREKLSWNLVKAKYFDCVKRDTGLHYLEILMLLAMIYDKDDILPHVRKMLKYVMKLENNYQLKCVYHYFKHQKQLSEEELNQIGLKPLISDNSECYQKLLYQDKIKLIDEYAITGGKLPQVGN